ncbi:MAG: hypothetical protein B6D64_10100, partial [Bacteroidetes bacterium 4484_276]
YLKVFSDKFTFGVCPFSCAKRHEINIVKKKIVMILFAKRFLIKFKKQFGTAINIKVFIELKFLLIVINYMQNYDRRNRDTCTILSNACTILAFLVIIDPIYVGKTKILKDG